MLTEADPKDCTLDSAGIGRRIRNARIEKHKTQEDVGAHYGCTSVHICNVENEKTVFRWNSCGRYVCIWISAWILL